MPLERVCGPGDLSGGEVGKEEVISKRLPTRHPTDTPCDKGHGGQPVIRGPPAAQYSAVTPIW